MNIITLGGFISSVLLTAIASQAGDKLFLRTGTVDVQSAYSVFSASRENYKTNDFVVQFKDAATEQDKALLQSLGFEIFKYLPEDAFIVSGPAARLNQVKALPQVNGVVPYIAEFKLSADFDAFSVFTANRVEKALIKTLNAAKASQVVTNLEKANIEILHAEANAILINATQDQIYKAATFDGVEHVQPYVQMVSMIVKMDEEALEEATPFAGDYNDLTGLESGTKIMSFDAAWARGFTGKNQVVAIADTGVDSGDINDIHPDLMGAVISGYAYGVFANSWNDPQGHGTHVAGSILMRGAASAGKIKGGAHEAQLVAQGMWSPLMDNLSVPPKLATMFSAAYKDGARVHSNSWGAPRNFGAYDGMAQQVDEYMWENPDMLILFAAGNSGVDKNRDGKIDENSVGSPGTAKNIVTVGASENTVSKGGLQEPIRKYGRFAENWPSEPILSDYLSNNANGLAAFSSRGPMLDGRLKPDVVAPGTNVLSLRSKVQGAHPLWGAYNEEYTFSGGTSMSTPLMAGAAAVARQYAVEKLGQANPSAAFVKAMLIHTAVDMFPGQYGTGPGQELLTPRPNVDEGYGRVDVEKVTSLRGLAVDNKTGVAQGEQEVHNFTTSRRGKLIATLTYTDAPGASSAAKVLVNDVDLVLVDSNGKETALNDRLNNVEMVEIKDLPAGQHKIIVKGYKIPQGRNGKQPYALLVTAEGSYRY